MGACTSTNPQSVVYTLWSRTHTTIRPHAPSEAVILRRRKEETTFSASPCPLPHNTISENSDSLSLRCPSALSSNCVLSRCDSLHPSASRSITKQLNCLSHLPPSPPPWLRLRVLARQAACRRDLSAPRDLVVRPDQAVLQPSARPLALNAPRILLSPLRLHLRLPQPPPKTTI